MLSRDERWTPAGDGPVVTTFVFRVRNVPAALYKALGGFATNGVNMTKLESYMEGGEFTATQFLADVDGHPEDPSLARALEELKFFSREVRILGVYPGPSVPQRIAAPAHQQMMRESARSRSRERAGSEAVGEAGRERHRMSVCVDHLARGNDPQGRAEIDSSRVASRLPDTLLGVEEDAPVRVEHEVETALHDEAQRRRVRSSGAIAIADCQSEGRRDSRAQVGLEPAELGEVIDARDRPPS